MMRKALISPGFGAGWSTWADARMRHDMLFDEAMIAAVEALAPGDHLSGAEPVVEDFERRMRDKYGEAPYCGGVDQLVVRVIDGEFRVEEHDGYERVIVRDDDEGWV